MRVCERECVRECVLESKMEKERGGGRESGKNWRQITEEEEEKREAERIGQQFTFIANIFQFVNVPPRVQNKQRAEIFHPDIYQSAGKVRQG